VSTIVCALQRLESHFLSVLNKLAINQSSKKTHTVISQLWARLAWSSGDSNFCQVPSWFNLSHNTYQVPRLTCTGDLRRRSPVQISCDGDDEDGISCPKKTEGESKALASQVLNSKSYEQVLSNSRFYSLMDITRGCICTPYLLIIYLSSYYLVLMQTWLP
jgi:hypothetical protein